MTELSGSVQRSPRLAMMRLAARADRQIASAWTATLRLMSAPEIPRFCIRKLIRCIEKLAISPMNPATATAQVAEPMRARGCGSGEPSDAFADCRCGAGYFEMKRSLGTSPRGRAPTMTLTAIAWAPLMTAPDNEP